MADSTAPSTPTAFARMYGVTNDDFLGPNKSGLTPLAYPGSKGHSKLLRRKHIRQYQQHYLLGFETSQFIAAGAMLHPAFPSSDIRPSNLTDLHPIFRREKWETALPRHLAFYPLGKTRPGEYWRADNDFVWQTLQPCLALASNIIFHFHLWDW
jgi:hypothetical protein